jgi:hypothetical protein
LPINSTVLEGGQKVAVFVKGIIKENIKKGEKNENKINCADCDYVVISKLVVHYCGKSGRDKI